MNPTGGVCLINLFLITVGWNTAVRNCTVQSRRQHTTGPYTLEVMRQGKFFGPASVSMNKDGVALWSWSLDQWPRNVRVSGNGSLFWTLSGPDEAPNQRSHSLKLCFYDKEGYLNAMHSTRIRRSLLIDSPDVPNISRIVHMQNEDLIVVGTHADQEVPRKERWEVFEMASGVCVKIVDPMKEFANLLFIDSVVSIGETPLLAVLWCAGPLFDKRETVSVWGLEQGEVFSMAFDYGGREARLVPGIDGHVIMVVPDAAEGISLEVYEDGVDNWAVRQL